MNYDVTCSLLTSDHTNVLFSCQKSSATADSSLLISGWYLLVTISNCRMAARFASKSNGSGPIARPKWNYNKEFFIHSNIYVQAYPFLHPWVYSQDNIRIDMCQVYSNKFGHKYQYFRIHLYLKKNNFLIRKYWPWQMPPFEWKPLLHRHNLPLPSPFNFRQLHALSVVSLHCTVYSKFIFINLLFTNFFATSCLQAAIIGFVFGIGAEFIIFDTAKRSFIRTCVLS